MATIPTYRDLEDRIEVLEGKLRYWSGLSSLEPADSIKKAMEEALDFSNANWVINDDGTRCQVDHILKKTDEWNEDRIDIIGQNGNDGLHYNEDEEGM